MKKKVKFIISMGVLLFSAIILSKTNAEVLRQIPVTYMNGDKVLCTEQVISGYTAKIECGILREGYNFKGWYVSEDRTEKFDFSEPIKGPVTLYAKFQTATPTNIAVEYLPFGSSFGYNQNTNIDIAGFRNGEDLIVTTPLLKDGNNEDVWQYYAMLSEQPYSERTNNIQGGNNFKQFIPQVTENGIGFDIIINDDTNGPMNASIQSGTTYYGVIVPKSDNNELGLPSQQFCFNLENETSALGDACETFDGTKPETLTYTVTFDSNRGTIVNSQTIASGSKVIRPINPEFPGYSFDGWFSDENLTQVFNFNSNINKDTTIYAKWTYQGVIKDLNVYFINKDETINHFTLMDRNLGASEIYNQNYENPNSTSYGYLYQWGNNYGFSNDVNSYTYSESQVPYNTWSKYTPSKYASSSFVMGTQNNLYNWMEGSSSTDNIRGGSSDDVTDKQGPCPTGYHIPSKAEWEAISTYRDNSRLGVTSYYIKEAGSLFASVFLMPFAGKVAFPSNTGEQPPHWTNQDSRGFYWASTSNGDSNGNGVTIGALNYYITFDGSSRANGNSVRCFKDSTSPSITINPNGGKNAIIAIDGDIITTLQSPIRDDEKTFEGWYADQGFTQRIETGSVVPNELFAKWEGDESTVNTGCDTDIIKAICENDFDACPNECKSNIKGKFSEILNKRGQILYENKNIYGEFFILDGIYKATGGDVYIEKYSIKDIHDKEMFLGGIEGKLVLDIFKNINNQKKIEIDISRIGTGITIPLDSKFKVGSGETVRIKLSLKTEGYYSDYDNKFKWDSNYRNNFMLKIISKDAENKYIEQDEIEAGPLIFESSIKDNVKFKLLEQKDTVFIAKPNQTFAKFEIYPTEENVVLNNISISMTNNANFDESELIFTMDGTTYSGENTSDGYTYFPNLNIGNTGIVVEIKSKNKMPGEYDLLISSINGNIEYTIENPEIDKTFKNLNKTFSRDFEDVLVYIKNQENMTGETKFRIGIIKNNNNIDVYNLELNFGERTIDGKIESGQIFTISGSNNDKYISQIYYKYIDENGVTKYININKNDYPDYFKLENGEERKVFARENNECVGMDSANISASVKDGEITLNWTTVHGSKNVDISIYNPDEGKYEKLATVAMSDGKYVYNIRWNGEQNFILKNECGEVIYKVDAKRKYNVIFKNFDGNFLWSGSMEYGVTPVYGGKTLVREGYIFDGWYTSQEGGEKLTSETYVNGDITYYVHRTPITYTIKFNSNGGEGSIDNINATYNQEYILPKNTFIRENYTFSGWSLSVNGSGIIYASGDKISNLTSNNLGEITLYAIWIHNLIVKIENENETGAMVIGDGTTISVGDNITPANPNIITSEENNSQINTGNIKNEINETLTGNNKESEIGGVVDISYTDVKGNKTGAIFSSPVAIKIHVPNGWNGPNGKDYMVKVKHTTDTKYGYVGLTLNPGAQCNNGQLYPENQYNGEVITPTLIGNQYYVIIYTCEASSFVAYSEKTVNQDPTQNNGGNTGGGSSSSGGGSSSSGGGSSSSGGGKSSPSTDKNTTNTGNVVENKANDKTENKTKSDNNTNNKNGSKNTNGTSGGDKIPAQVFTFKSSEYLNGNPGDILDNGYTREMNNAYQFAYKNGIITSNTIDKAKMNEPLTRIAMAKILSNYAINILGKKPDPSLGTVKFDDVTEKQNADYDNAVTLSYQLGIMGQNIKNNKFRPNDEVTRAEFATAFSRLLYSTSDGNPYYTNHLRILKQKGIITNDNPNIKEKRGYVMVMLMRTTKS